MNKHWGKYFLFGEDFVPGNGLKQDHIDSQIMQNHTIQETWKMVQVRLCDQPKLTDVRNCCLEHCQTLFDVSLYFWKALKAIKTFKQYHSVLNMLPVQRHKCYRILPYFYQKLPYFAKYHAFLLLTDLEDCLCLKTYR